MGQIYKRIWYSIIWRWSSLEKTNEKRFAICILKTNQYIGNIQLTDITETDAQFHIFIGETEFWNQGIGTKATNLLIEYGINTLGLSSIYLYVNSNNKPAIKSYLKNGFDIIQSDNEKVKMIFTIETL